MPTQLRSGQLKDAPKQKYISGFSIFREERNKVHHGEANIVQIISKEWENLDDKKREGYEKQYEDYYNEFKDQLYLFYGGSKNDLKKVKQGDEIPDKPKRPAAPHLRYYADASDEVTRKNPDEQRQAIQKLLSEQYSQLSQKERAVYEKQYDTEFEKYKKELERWKEKYQSKSDAYDEFLEDKFRRITTPNAKDFVYEELQPVKRPRKIKEQPRKSTEKQKKRN